MKLTTKSTEHTPKKDEVIALFFHEDDQNALDSAAPPFIKKNLADINTALFLGKPAENLFFTPKSGPALMLIGLGKKEKASLDIYRNAGGVLAGLCRDRGIKTVHVALPAAVIDGPSPLAPIAEGIMLANYSFDRYKNRQKTEKRPLENTIILTNDPTASKIDKEIEFICSNTLYCRDLVNELSTVSNPVNIAGAAKKLASNKAVQCRVLGKKEIEKLGMGLLLAVNRGSAMPPQLVVLTYTGNPRSKKYAALVGKGITFDSGGMNLKGSGNIETMRMDMAGAAAVLATIKACAELGLKKNVYGVLPLTENMLSNTAYRPGDIFKGYNGKTVEIGNTDAEGRLILADALAYTEKNLKPDSIVDIATLTGACIVAFGETIAGFLSNDPALRSQLVTASRSTGEKIWELPLDPAYDENLKSEVADLSNISSEKNAGTIIGATFLKNFIEKARWAHIDIAGTAWYSKPRGFNPRMATGFGVRLFVELLKNWQ